MFNDRYGLTYAVIDEIKNNTRRIEGGKQFQLAATAAEDFTYEEATGWIVMCCQGVEIFRHKCRYKVGEIVAVAQSYENAGVDPEYPIEGVQLAKEHAGWRNKMFVSAKLMPYRIRITGVRCERLQGISDEECMKEGVVDVTYFKTGGRPYELFALPGHEYEETFNTPRQAFAALIDKVSGRGTWGRNPWVVAYEFELVK
nr:MAG TPA: ASCH domain protein [Caudoviricetes sp.]